MSYPKKSVNLRSVMVNDVQFRWRFSARQGKGVLFVYGPISGCQPLKVVLGDWQDYWLAFPTPTQNHPQVVGPSFAVQAIEFGLSHGWKPEEKGQAISIEWKQECFLLPS